MDRDFDKSEGEWFPVMNQLAEKLITTDLTKIESRILWMFLRYCYGYNKPTCELRWADMRGISGFGDGSLSKAIQRLKERNIIQTFHTESKSYVTYKINSKIGTWKDKLSIRKDFPYGKKTLHIRKVNTSHMESVPIKDNIKTKDKSRISKKSKGNNVKIPEWLDIEIWNELKKYRKAKFTPHAQKLAITKLEKLRAEGHDPTEVINQTILCGWSGLFPIKKGSAQETGKSIAPKSNQQCELERIMKL